MNPEDTMYIMYLMFQGHSFFSGEISDELSKREIEDIWLMSNHANIAKNIIDRSLDAALISYGFDKNLIASNKIELRLDLPWWVEVSVVSWRSDTRKRLTISGFLDTEIEDTIRVRDMVAHLKKSSDNEVVIVSSQKEMKRS